MSTFALNVLLAANAARMSGTWDMVHNMAQDGATDSAILTECRYWLAIEIMEAEEPCYAETMLRHVENIARRMAIGLPVSGNLGGY